MGFALEKFKNEPWRWVDFASKLATETIEWQTELEEALAGLSRPVVSPSEEVREAFWSVLIDPKRHIGLNWLSDMKLMEEFLPCWTGITPRKKLRLKAVEQVHLETWKEGLEEDVFKTICEIHDKTIDHRLNGWGLTALSTLLAGGDLEKQDQWSKNVRRGLFELGATEPEIVWVEKIVQEYRRGVKYVRGEDPDGTVSAQLAVVLLSTMSIAGEDSKEEYMLAAKRVNEALR